MLEVRTAMSKSTTGQPDAGVSRTEFSYYADGQLKQMLEPRSFPDDPDPRIPTTPATRHFKRPSTSTTTTTGCVRSPGPEPIQR